MKKFWFLFAAAAALTLVPSVFAQTSLKGSTLNGSTGLYSVPSGRIGWERSSDLALDFGYRAIINNSGTAHIYSVTTSLFKWVEIAAALDFQPNINEWKYDGNPPHAYLQSQHNDDLLFGFKVQLPTNIKNSENPAVALGTNIQIINIADDDSNRLYKNIHFTYTTFQFYAAVTYAGTFFTLPAETTLAIGKTIYVGGPDTNSDIDFGMGFDLVLFPDVFKNVVHWLVDFANFDYNNNAWPNHLSHEGGGPSWYRGNMSTGLRIDLAAIPALSKFKFNIDMVFNDLLDNGNRSFTVGAVFGFSILDAK